MAIFMNFLVNWRARYGAEFWYFRGHFVLYHNGLDGDFLVGSAVSQEPWKPLEKYSLDLKHFLFIFVTKTPAPRCPIWQKVSDTHDTSYSLHSKSFFQQNKRKLIWHLPSSADSIQSKAAIKWVNSKCQKYIFKCTTRHVITLVKVNCSSATQPCGQASSSS